MRRISIARAATALVLAACLELSPVAARADEPAPVDEAQFEATARRFEQILTRRPRRGTAFDLWYRHYLDAGRLDRLIESVAQRAKANPQDPAAQVLLGLVREREGQMQEALDAYAAAERHAPDDYYPLYLRGTLLIREGRLDDAAPALLRALERDPPRTDYLDIAQTLGRAFFRQGKPQEALDVWSDVAAKFPDDRQILEQLAGLLAQERQYDAAIRRWEQVAELAKDDLQARLQARIEVGQLHIEKGNRAVGVKLLDRALDDVKPDSWQARDIRERIAQAFLRDGDVQWLVTYCEGRLARRPDNLDTLLQLADALSAAERADEALDAYRRAVAAAPTRKDVRQALLRELVRERDFAQAVLHGEELARQHPADADVLRTLGGLYLDVAVDDEREKAERQAAATWQRIAAIRPHDPTLALQTAEACRRAVRTPVFALSQRGDSDDEAAPQPSVLLTTAERYYREAVRRSSGSPQYHEYLGEFLHSQGRRKEAVAAWSQMAVGANDAAENWYRLAEVYAGSGYLEEAVAAAGRAVAHDAKNFRFRDYQIDLCLRAERYDEALALLPDLRRIAEDPALRDKARERAVEVYAASGRIDAEIRRLQDESKQAALDDHLLLAMLLVERERLPEAHQSLAAALAESPDEVRLLRLQAEVLRHLHDLPGAVRLYRRLAEVDADYRLMHYRQLVQLQLGLGRAAEAREAADRLLDLAPASLDAYRLRADVAFRMNDRDGGLRVLRRGVQMAPQDLGIRMDLARALAQHRQPREALEHYWRCLETAPSADEQRAVVAAMLDVPGTPAQQTDLIARLDRMRRRQGHSKALTLCLVDAYHRTKQFDRAGQELRELADLYGDDVDVLRRLVVLDTMRQQWDEAASWQERIVALHPTAETLQSLAKLYQRKGDAEAAAAAWQRLLQQTRDERPFIAEIDRHLAAGQADIALAMIERGLKELPESWRLLHRAACAHFAARQYDKAADGFERVLALDTKDAGQPPTPMRELQLARTAHAKFVALEHRAGAAMPRPRQRGTVVQGPAVVAVQGRTVRIARGKTVRFLQGQPQFVGMPLSGTGDLHEAQIESAVALYLTATQQGRLASWVQERRERGKTDPRALRQLVLAFAGAGKTETASEIVDELIERAPDDPLPHLARLTVVEAPQAGQLLTRSQADRRRTLEDLQASFQWVGAHQPALKAGLLSHYGERVIALGGPEIAAEMVLEEMEHARSLRDLGQLPLLAMKVYDADFHRRFLTEAARLSSPPAAATADEAATMLRIGLDRLASHEISDAVADAAVTLLMQSLAAAPRGGTVRATSRSGLPPRVTVLPNGKVARPAPSNRIDQARRLLSEIRKAENVIAELKARRTAADVQVQATLQQQQNRKRGYENQLAQLGVTVNHPLLQPFPGPGGHLTSEQFVILSEVAAWLHRSGEEGRLLARLAQQTAGDERDAAKWRHVRLCVLWWSDRQDEAFALLRAACEADPDSPLPRLTLAKALYSARRLAEAMRVINRISPDPQRSIPSVESLRADILRDWEDVARLATLEGHTHVVRAVAFSPDGQRLASAGYDLTVRLWDVAERSVESVCRGHEELVLCVQFSPDGTRLATGSLDGQIRLWDADGGEERKAWEGHEKAVRSVAFSPDGSRLASAGDDGLVRIWSVADGRIEREFAGHHGGVCCVAFAPDGRLVASAGIGRTVRLWKAATGTEVRALDGHTNFVRGLAFSPDGRRLATGGDDETVRLWNVATGHCEATLSGHTATVSSVAFAPDGSLLASAGGDNTIRFWQADGTPQVALTGHGNSVTSIAFSPDGRTVATGSFDRTVRLWKVLTVDGTGAGP